MRCAFVLLIRDLASLIVLGYFFCSDFFCAVAHRVCLAAPEQSVFAFPDCHLYSAVRAIWPLHFCLGMGTAGRKPLGIEFCRGFSALCAVHWLIKVAYYFYSLAVVFASQQILPANKKTNYVVYGLVFYTCFA